VKCVLIPGYSKTFSQLHWYRAGLRAALGPGYLCSVALGYGLDDRGFESREGLGIFLFTTAFRMALGTTQPPIQCVLGSLSVGIKGQRREADHSPLSSAEVKNAWKSHGVKSELKSLFGTPLEHPP
jgi:hypothetical protein